MERKDFLKRGIFGVGTIIAIPSVLTACSKDDATTDSVATDT